MDEAEVNFLTHPQKVSSQWFDMTWPDLIVECWKVIIKYRTGSAELCYNSLTYSTTNFRPQTTYEVMNYGQKYNFSCRLTPDNMLFNANSTAVNVKTQKPGKLHVWQTELWSDPARVVDLETLSVCCGENCFNRCVCKLLFLIATLKEWLKLLCSYTVIIQMTLTELLK